MKELSLYLPIFISVASITISIFGLFYIIANHKIIKDQSFRDLFREFNKRFDDINESLNEIVHAYSDSRLETKIIQDYLNLCSEEYLWKKKKRIPKSVWEAWEAGIIDYLKKSQKIKDHFVDEYKRGHDKSYYGFLSYILPRINTTITNAS